MTIYSSLKHITPHYKETVITKKEISWFEKMPGFSCEVQTKAIAEYLGMFKAEHMNKHGNAKITKQEYIRTSPITKNQIISEIKTGKPVRNFFLKNFSQNINLVIPSLFIMLNTSLAKKMHMVIDKKCY
jgi:hypothetical protein